MHWGRSHLSQLPQPHATVRSLPNRRLKALKALEKGGLVHLERLASVLRGLTPEELETLELLLDRRASAAIRRALKELDLGEGIPLEKG